MGHSLGTEDAVTFVKIIEEAAMKTEKLHVVVTHPLSIIAGAILLFLLMQTVIMPHGPAISGHSGVGAMAVRPFI